MKTSTVDKDGTHRWREIVVREARSDFHGTTTYRTLAKITEGFEELQEDVEHALRDWNALDGEERHGALVHVNSELKEVLDVLTFEDHE